MSSTITPKFFSYVANTDLRTKQYHAVKFSGADHQIALAAATEGFGVLYNKPNTTEAAEVAVIGGGAKGILGGTVTRGNSLKVDANGKFIAAIVGDRALAVAEQSGVVNDIIGMILDLHQA